MLLVFSLVTKASLACGPEPDFVTKHGLYVFTNGLPQTQHEIETVASETILAMASRDEYILSVSENSLNSKTLHI